MNTTTKAIHKTMAAIIAVLLICASIVFPVIAADYSSGTDSQHPAQAAITKILRMPNGTNIPDYKFEFTFKEVDIDGDATKTADMPGIKEVTVDFSDKTGITQEIKGGSTYEAKSSDDFIKGGDFSQGPAGVYRYEVTETQGKVDSLVLSDKEHLTYSTAKYYIDIYVEYDETAKTHYVKYVNGVIIEDELDEWYEDTEIENGKLNPDPDGPGGDGISGGHSNLVFTNRYWKTTGGGEGGDDPNYSALTIKKIITSNIKNENHPFKFEVKVTTPELAVHDDGTQIVGTYKAYIMKNDGSNDAVVYDSRTNQDGYYTFTSAVEKTIELKHGEWLAFVDLEVGAKVSVYELAEDEYRSAYKRNFSVDIIDKMFTAPDVKTDWGFPDKNPADAGPHYTEEG
ncbi:MAG: hypothetical protein FWD23_05780, partial [Oscillospiraceae bacterium]|nr:hypothetical protein [Oscillospiraceae bacterium]